MAENKKEKIRLCDVLDYEKDIKPFPLIKLYSGVGSGKSYFASKMILGSTEYKIPEQNVLLITSRRSKVEETLKEMGVAVTEKITKNGNLSTEIFNTGEDRPYEYEKFLKEIKIIDAFGVEHTVLTYNKSVICTNSYIAAYLHYVHDPKDPITHIWNKFDTIIVDEVHSLITDATYQSASFSLLSLIKEYLLLYQSQSLQECACKHIILMTGTPEPFEKFVKLNFPKELTNTKYLFKECENVVPENIIIIDKDTANFKIKESLLNGQKVIYFSNHTLTEASAREKFDLPETINIGVSFSNEKKRKILEDKERDKIKTIEDSLADKSLIPDEIQLFVTTSRNKEGINIHNKDIHKMSYRTLLQRLTISVAKQKLVIALILSAFDIITKNINHSITQRY